MSPSVTQDVLENKKKCCFFGIHTPDCPAHSIATLLTMPQYSPKCAVVILYPLTHIKFQNNSV
jgi:hypothetical protein